MSFDFRFQSILQLKENEKKEAHTLYEKSVENFEEKAQQLYDLLKKKEDLEQFQSSKLANGFSIQEIRHYQHFIDNLTNVIMYWQNKVAVAREQMNYQKSFLTESSIEVKKYEKMKEKSYEYYLEEVNSLENNKIDEIASIQYYHRRGS